MSKTIKIKQDIKKLVPTIPIIQRGISLYKMFVFYLTSLISLAEKSPTFSTPKS